VTDPDSAYGISIMAVVAGVIAGVIGTWLAGRRRSDPNEPRAERRN